MIRQADQPDTDACPTIWGLDPVRLHDYYWAARGVHVVRQGDVSHLPHDAELYLLTDSRRLCIFRLRPIIEDVSWLKPQLLLIRLHNRRDGYRENVVQDAEGRFVEFRRRYGGADARLARVGLTPHRWVAQLWLDAPDAATGWQTLRRSIKRIDRDATTLNGRAYERSDRAELAQFVRDLVKAWEHPVSTIREIHSIRPGVWAYKDAQIDPAAQFVGNTWIGAGRGSAPRIQWSARGLVDDAAARPEPQDIRWRELEAWESWGEFAVHRR